MTHNMKEKIVSALPGLYPEVAELIRVAARYEALLPGHWYVVSHATPELIDRARNLGLLYVRAEKKAQRHPQLRLSPKARSYVKVWGVQP